MKSPWLLLFVLLPATVPAAAQQPLDCTALKSTLAPFAVTYRMTRSAPDGSGAVSATGEQMQVFRRPAETLAYNVTAPGQFSRSRSPGSGLLPREVYSSATRSVRTWTYSFDVTADYVAAARPLEFTGVLREPDGSLVTEARMTLAFADTTTVQAQGCSFTVVKLVRTMDGTNQGRPLVNRMESWWSPELRVSLFTRIANPNFMATAVAAGMARDFTPVE